MVCAFYLRYEEFCDVNVLLVSNIPYFHPSYDHLLRGRAAAATSRADRDRSEALYIDNVEKFQKRMNINGISPTIVAEEAV